MTLFDHRYLSMPASVFVREVWGELCVKKARNDTRESIIRWPCPSHTVFELRAATAYASYRHMSKKKLLKTTKSVKIKLMEFKLLCVIFFSFFVPFFLLHTRARGASIRSCFTVRSLVSLYARTHTHTHTPHTHTKTNMHTL